MKKKAIIISIKGYRITTKEKSLFKNEKPWGLILFKRNIKSYFQLKNLIKTVRKLSKDNKFPIMIDEEGGSVKRLTNIIDFQISQKFFGDMYKYNTNISILTLKKYNHNISSTLKSLGINMNTVPVLDVLEKNTHKIIGDRSFSKDPKIVKILGKEWKMEYQGQEI